MYHTWRRGGINEFHLIAEWLRESKWLAQDWTIQRELVTKQPHFQNSTLGSFNTTRCLSSQGHKKTRSGAWTHRSRKRTHFSLLGLFFWWWHRLLLSIWRTLRVSLSEGSFQNPLAEEPQKPGHYSQALPSLVSRDVCSECWQQNPVAIHFQTCSGPQAQWRCVCMNTPGE